MPATLILPQSRSRALAFDNVRSVFVFPQADLDWVRQELARVAREEPDGRWLVDAADGSGSAALYIELESTTDDVAPLFCDWEPAAVERLRAALGRVPEWSVTADVSGRIPGGEEVRAFVLALLAKGGVAIDDYSDHPWTAAEIAENRTRDGLRFFDYRTSFEQSREAES